ncbi:MAG: cobalamin B12-binding domain protein [Verrucomicrobiales bacterium]|nr:cobalamin B12-binding domain protein [Verrucomicrobiales bacterium]
MPDYAFMNQCLYEGKAKEVGEMTIAALAEGRSVKEVLTEGLIAGMSVVGEDFKYNILYVPEVLIAARAMKAGMLVLKPLLAAKDSDVQPAGVLVMGTVRGDLHDIGKNLVCMMAEGAGFQVHDIGVDQSIEKFLTAYDLHKPNIIGMSALLTTTMTYMKTVIDGFEEKGLGHVKMAIGGAPISQMYADEIGADGYGADASSAVDLFLHFVGKGVPPSFKTKLEAAAPVIAERAAGAKTRDPNAKSKFQILYWQDIPSEVKAWDDFDEIKGSLPTRFAELIDESAQKQGLTTGDAYMTHLRWSDEAERAGTPQEVVDAIRKEMEAKFLAGASAA